MFPPANMQADAQYTELDLLQALHEDRDDAALIASTVRAARFLRQRYDAWQADTGNTGWLTPRIFSWDAWVEQLWDAAVLMGTETRTRLTETQELELWRTVLAQDETARRTLSVEALAGLAHDSWTQMQRYRIAPEQLRGGASQDTQAFLRWAGKFEQACKQRSFLSPAQTEAALAGLGRGPRLPLPQTVLLLGFDRMTPSQSLLLDFVGASGCHVRTVDLQPGRALHGRADDASTPQPAIVCAATVDEEIDAAAHWAKEALDRDPRHRIGVIVTGLEALLPAIDASFRRTMAAASMDVRSSSVPPPYEFSLGTPMDRVSAVSTALLLLRWLQGAISMDDLSWLVVHGELGGQAADWRDPRARLDRKFRERRFRLGAPVSLPAFRQWLNRAGGRAAQGSFSRCLEQFAVEAGRLALKQRRVPAEWRDAIEQLLTAAGWRLLSPANSTEYQLLLRWNAVLDELASLGSVLGAVSFSVARDKLEGLAASTLFTQETRNAPIQVLGVAESAGLAFDAVWWMNVSSESWPLRGTALPFLPWRLQRDAGMPYAAPETDTAFALRTTKRILSCAATVVASFARESGAQTATRHADFQRETLLSPSIREALPEIPIVGVEEMLPSWSRPGSDSAAPEAALDRIAEEPAVPFEPTDLRGGVRFLELQAACPFRAFAELRLGARPLDEAAAGLSPAEQGTVLHAVLDSFWKQVRSSEDLRTGAPAEHGEILRGCIREALARHVPQSNEPWRHAFLAIEAERLEQRLLAWLEKEKDRPAFHVVETEEKHAVRLAEIGFHCRVDRVDKVDKGLVLLDYKTGVVERSACDGDRPDQPQLPAYAALGLAESEIGGPLAGIAFAGLHPRKVGLTVIRSQAGVFKAGPPPASEERPASAARKQRWDPGSLSAAEMLDQQHAWEVTLTRLAEQFRSGAAIVDPKRPSTTCKHCRQRLLCRIQETAATLEDDEGERLTGENDDLAGSLLS